MSLLYGFGIFSIVTLNTSILTVSAASLSHIAEELSGLLEQSHQATLSEVASRTHPILVWGQDVI